MNCANPAATNPSRWRESQGDWLLDIHCRDGETITATVQPARDGSGWNWTVTGRPAQQEPDSLLFARIRAREAANRLADDHGGPA